MHVSVCVTLVHVGHFEGEKEGQETGWTGVPSCDSTCWTISALGDGERRDSQRDQVATSRWIAWARE